MAANTERIINIAIDSVIIGIMVFVFIPIIFFTNVRWRSWNLFHWLTRYKLPWCPYKYNLPKRQEINARVSIYSCLGSLQLFAIMRTIAYIVSLVEFIVNPDITDLYLKAAVMITKDIGVFMHYVPLTFLAFVWLGVCSPVLRNDGAAEGRQFIGRTSLGRWIEKVGVERKDLLLKLFIVYPLFTLTMVLVVSGTILGLVLGFMIPSIGFGTFQGIRNKSYFFIMMAGDISMVTMFLILGTALGVILYSSIRVKRGARVPSSQLTRQRDTIIRVSVVVTVFVIVTICRVVGTTARLTAMPFWIYNLLQSTLVESLEIVALVFLFSSIDLSCKCIPWLSVLFKPLQIIETMEKKSEEPAIERKEEEEETPAIEKEEEETSAIEKEEGAGTTDGGVTKEESQDVGELDPVGNQVSQPEMMVSSEQNV